MQHCWKWITATFKTLRDQTLLRQLSLDDRKLIAQIRSKRLTYLGAQKLICLVKTCRSIENQHLPGAFVEAGCALGGSSILIASLKNPDREQLIFDVFDMIPAPSQNDTPEVHERYQVILSGKSTGIGGDVYYGYQKNLYEIVRNNLTEFGMAPESNRISLIKGLVQDTMNINQPVAMAHIDVDWYDPVKTCLDRIWPHLVTGGSIILDDYCSWGGCQKATDEFIQTIPNQYWADNSAGSMKLTKKDS